MGGSHRLFGSCPAIHLLHKKLALSRVGRPPRDSPTTPFHHLPKQAPPRKSSRPERAETDVVELLTHYTSTTATGSRGSAGDGEVWGTYFCGRRFTGVIQRSEDSDRKSTRLNSSH